MLRAAQKRQHEDEQEAGGPLRARGRSKWKATLIYKRLHEIEIHLHRCAHRLPIEIAAHNRNLI